jgi:hypothetical protein
MARCGAWFGWSQPPADRGDQDGGLEADREFVEPCGHRPVAFSKHARPGGGLPTDPQYRTKVTQILEFAKNS